MRFEDKLGAIYRFFRKEYIASSFEYYAEFLESKDIGIIRIDDYIRTDFTYLYEIVDEKKWALSRIKYGI